MRRPCEGLLLLLIFIYYICRRQAETPEDVARERGVGAVGRRAWVIPNTPVPPPVSEDPDEEIENGLVFGGALSFPLQPPKTSLFIDSYQRLISATPPPSARRSCGCFEEHTGTLTTRDARLPTVPAAFPVFRSPGEQGSPVPEAGPARLAGLATAFEGLKAYAQNRSQPALAVGICESWGSVHRSHLAYPQV